MRQTIRISSRVLNDLSLLATGVFDPVTRFMTFDEAQSVVDHLALPTGQTFPIPILLQTNDLPHHIELKLVHGDEIVGSLRLLEGFRIPLQEWARKIYGTEDEKHPGVAAFFAAGQYAITGDIEWLGDSSKVAHGVRWLTPQETRAEIARRAWRHVAGFQTRNPIHRAHEHLLRIALEMTDGLLVQPLVGETIADDIAADTRLRSYRALLDNHFPTERLLLSTLPAWKRYAGPREAVLHAIVHRNFGCTHFIVGRDHAGVGSNYGPYDAQKLVASVSGHIGIEPIFFDEVFYCARCRGMASTKTCSHGSSERLALSGTEVRRRLRNGESLPEELIRGEVASVLYDAFRLEAADA